jgi:chromosome segregation ATPase
LQNDVKKKEEALESRGNEVNDLKSKIDGQMKQVAELELAVQKVKVEAASQAERAEHLSESLKAKIAAMEAQLRDTEEIVRKQESTIKGLEKNLTDKVQDFESQVRNKEELLAGRDAEISDLKSQLKLLTDAAQEIVSPETFQRIIDELTEVMDLIGRLASVIVREHVASLGESMKTFPKTRLPELLESLSKELLGERKTDFRERIFVNLNVHY